MRVAGIILVLIALALGGFAYWGISTDSGRRRYDEMAGMIPFFAGIAGGGILLIGIALLLLPLFRR